MEYMILPFKRYFDFQGRSRRMEFWMFLLLNILVYLVLAVVVFGMGSGFGAFEGIDPDDTIGIYGALFSGSGILFGIWWLITIIPTISVSVRRFHDRDMSGWWYLGVIVGSLIPFLGFIVSIGYLVVMALPGTPGPNRFGPDPKNPTSADVFE